MEFQQSDLNYHGYKEYKYGEFGKKKKFQKENLTIFLF